MKKLKKLLSLIISTALLITTIPINSFSANYPVLPQYEFSNFAKITSANFYDSDTTVINIQDLHNNKEVQDNIYKLLDSLNKQYENFDVYIEGATDFIDYSKLSEAMSDNELSALMNALYETDKISGAELFGYKNGKVLKPTEQKEIYEQNIQNYSFLIKNKQQINDLLFKRYIKIKTLDKYLTAEQRKILKFYNAYLNKKISSEKFYNKIYNELIDRKISALKYINTKLYIDVMKASKNINQKSAEKQLQTVLLKLKNTITYQDYINLLKDSNNLTDINVIFAYLSANISRNDKITKYPDLFNLISLRELSSLINPLDLIEEEREILEYILLSYSKYSQNKDIVFLNLFFQVYKKLLSAGISSSEYEYYKENYYKFSKIYSKYLSNDLFELYPYARVAEQFNELNLKRNLSFIKNLSKDINTDKNYNSFFKGKLYNINKILNSLNKTKSVKVIVSGGFHTEGINELLNRNKISYITLTPNVKENDSLYEQKYLDSIVEQAEVEINAIAKRPFLEQNSQIIISNVVSSLDSILKFLKDGKSFEEIKNIINGVIEANSLKDFVTFDMSDDGLATIEIDGKIYTLNYEKDKIVVQDNFSTTLAKNIKALIREALKVANIRSILGLKEKYDGTIGSGITQEAEYFFMRHNILFPGFADLCLRAIVGDSDPDVTDRSKDNVYQSLLKVKNSFMGEMFKCDITVGKAKSLVGARPDGYGNTEEYGSLFYVVWEKNIDGAYVAKDILVSSILLESLQDFTEQDLKRFFTNLFIHERLEMLALTGASEKFNQYVLEHKLSRTSEIFHQYIQSTDFNSFLLEQGMSSSNIKEQRDLLKEMDIIISEVNKANSQYSNIISVSSLDKDKSSYGKDVIKSFLTIRTGQKKAIDEYKTVLLRKIISQIEKEYVLTQKTKSPDFDIEKDLNEENMDDFINFINKFVVVYRKSNNYISCDDFAVSIKKALINKYKIPHEKAVTIFIASYELDETSKGNVSLKDSKNVKGKNIFFIEDIISKQSETFNYIYNTLMSYGADKVQGAVFFDLSKEPEGSNLISDSVYKQIMEDQDNSGLFDAITSVNGNIQKYLAYWLVKLYQSPNGREILKQISTSMNSETVNNLMNSLMDMVKENNFVKGVKCYEIINLMLFIGFGEYKDVNSITKSDMDDFLKKYDFRIKDKGDNLALEVSYDDWKESVASLILYAYMLGYDYIDAIQINNIFKKHGNNKLANIKIIDSFCKEFNISFMDKKTKLKHTYKTDDIDVLSEEIKTQKEKLQNARKAFKDKAKKINAEYETSREYEKYLAEMDKISDEYRSVVKEIMISAKEIVVKKLALQHMKIDDNLFAIIIGGSLVKGNMMAESDIYYDIIVPDGTISKSIDKHFAPLYSSVLQEIGLTSYYVLKYSTSNMNRRNINTFVDEKDIAPFLNYSLLSVSDSKKKLFLEYRNKIIEDIKKQDQKNITKIQQNLSLITKKYFNISKKGKSWLGNSFHIAYDGNKSFSTKWTIMALESKLNEIVFQYIVSSNDENIMVPVSVKEQIEFIKQHNLLKKEFIDNLEFYWDYLSACRYAKDNNTWTDISPMEQKAIDEINGFVSSFSIAEPLDEDSVNTKNNSAYLLSLIEEFVYDNSTDIGEFRRGYDKYSHLEAWKGNTDAKNSDIFIKAQIIDLLVEIDSPEIREKLSQTKISKKDLNFIFESLDAIKLIDEKFPKYSALNGERSLQNYWDAVVTTVKNPETMFALIAHKLTKAQNSQDKEDQLLLYSVYLPLSKRFGNPEIYEYVRNDSFECSHPVEYLNLLNVISVLYGIPYSQLKENNEDLKQILAQYLEKNGLNMNDIEINIRVKSLYSIYEKLTSSRKQDNTELKSLNKTERNAIKFVVNSDLIFNNLVKRMNLKNISPKSIRKQILGCIDKSFDELTPKEKELLSSVFGEMKNSIFSDYNFIDYINGNLEKILGKCKGDDGLVDMEKLRDLLEADGFNKALELWFVTLFEAELKDLVGFHVVIKDEDFPKLSDVVNIKTNNESYSGLKTFFRDRGIIFQKFEKDKKNKQARTKMNASIKVKDGVPVPVEMCLYTRTNHNNETYGLYNQGKISAPHYIYKMGKDFDASLFEHIFAKKMDYSFIDPTDKEKKQMVYESDNFVPTDDLYDNFEKIMSKISDSVTCFVEYDDGIYVQKLPKDSTVFDLATGKMFSDDINVAVYVETGDQITSDFPLENARTYKIIKRLGCYVAVPNEETDVHTKRAKVIYHRMKTHDKTSLSDLIKSIGSVSAVNDFLNELLTNEDFREMLDARNMDYSEIAEKMLNEGSKNEILRNKDFITNVLSELFNIILSNDFENMLPSQFIKRAAQIANHYNLANLFELFEAVEDGIIKIEDIKPFFNMCFVLKTKANISADDIIDILSSSLTIKKMDVNDNEYNLVINDEKFFVENMPLIDEDSTQAFISLLNSENIGLKIEHVAYKDEQKTKAETEKDTVFVSVDFVRPAKAFPLMSLGNNIENLVKHAMINHSFIVSKILETTKELSEKYDSADKDEESMGTLLDEYPVLMTQILLGLYSQESYDEKTLLTQETPYLLEEELKSLKDEIKNPDLTSTEISVLKQFLPHIFDAGNLMPTNISDVNIVVSRSLDLVEDEDIYSFTTMSVDEKGVATLYISEAFLRELDKLSAEKKQNLLRNLAVHEIIEYIALSANPDMVYTEVHNAFDKIDSQEELMNFVKQIIPAVLRTKESLFEEVDSLLNVSDTIDKEPNTTVAFLLGNRTISSFTDTFNLYRKGIVGKIFISGNRRGTVDIISKIRKEQKYMKNIRKTITSLEDVHTVEDLLSLTDEAFAKLEREDNDFILTGKSTQTYLDKINKNRQVSEAYIIKWVILEDAKQAGLSEKEIEKLKKDIILETEAFNTPQNINNLFEHSEFIDYISGRENINIILIQTPFSQSRALATLNKYLHLHKDKGPLKGKKFNIKNIDFGKDSQSYHYDNVEALKTSLGEWTRLIVYSLKGDIVPLIQDAEGIDAIPLEVLRDIISLLPLLDKQDKEELFKIFMDAAKQDSNFETADKLLTLLQQQLEKGARFDLISSFIKYMYADSTEQRQLEKTWDEMQPEDVLPDLVAQEQKAVDERVDNIHKILAAA